MKFVRWAFIVSRRLADASPSSRGGLVRPTRVRPLLFAALALAAGVAGSLAPARADRIENGVAVFAALDKVTARISKLEVPLGQTVQFGALKVTPRACYSRPPTEAPKTTTFVEIQETQLDGKESRLFAGWMFAESPGLNAVEHPVFDVWLTECQKPLKAQAQAAQKPAAEGKAGTPRAGAAQPAAGVAQPPSSGEEAPAEPRRRVRR